MKIWKQAIAISAVSLFATGVLASGKGQGRMEERFKEADTDGNGVVTHEEMLEKVRGRFSMFDKDDDGYITLAELPEEMPVPEHVRERMEKRAKRMEERMKERGMDADDMPPPEMRGMGPKGKPTRIRFIARHDHDGDERVSFEEFSRKAVERFKRMDIDGDGQVTSEETRNAFEHHRKGMRDGKGMKRPHGQ